MSKQGYIKILSAIMLLFSLAGTFIIKAGAAELSGARAAVLIDAKTCKILYQRNAYARLPMASTTKIMTALVALKYLEPQEELTVPPEAVGVEGTSASFSAGEVYSLEEMLYALLLQSANDAAAAIAISIGGTTEGFAVLMNHEARMMGLSDSNFKNPHGLPDSEHYTSAYDLALIASKALQNETIAKIVSCKSARIESADGIVRYFYNHNKMLSYYKGACGVKTGFTKASGRCLVSSAERDGVKLIAVTLGSNDDWREHTRMLDFGFDALAKAYK